MSRYTVLFQVKTSLNRVTPDIFFANVDTFLGKFMSFDNSFATAFFPKWTRKWSFCTLGILGQPWFGYSKLWNVKHISVRRNFIYPLYISSNTCLENIHISIFSAFQFEPLLSAWENDVWVSAFKTQLLNSCWPIQDRESIDWDDF